MGVHPPLIQLRHTRGWPSPGATAVTGLGLARAFAAVDLPLPALAAALAVVVGLCVMLCLGHRWRHPAVSWLIISGTVFRPMANLPCKQLACKVKRNRGFERMLAPIRVPGLHLHLAAW